MSQDLGVTALYSKIRVPEKGPGEAVDGSAAQRLHPHKFWRDQYHGITSKTAAAVERSWSETMRHIMCADTLCVLFTPVRAQTIVSPTSLMLSFTQMDFTFAFI